MAKKLHKEIKRGIVNKKSLKYLLTVSALVIGGSIMAKKFNKN